MLLLFVFSRDKLLSLKTGKQFLSSEPSTKNLILSFTKVEWKASQLNRIIYGIDVMYDVC